MADTQSALIIEEIGVPGAITISLESDDLPEGGPRERAAWEEGGQVKLGNDEGDYFPGNPNPVYHVLQARFRPRVMKGAFRDHLWGEEGHARRMRDDIERLRGRANLVKVTWDIEGFTGFLHETKFGFEGPGDITYELAFNVSAPHGLAEAQPKPRAHDNAGADLVAQFQADAQNARAAQEALALHAAVQVAYATRWDALETALGDVLTATMLLESGAAGKAQQARATVQRTIAAARACADQAKALAAALDGVAPGAVLIAATAPAVAAWNSSQTAIIAEMRSLRDAMRSVAERARQQLNVAERIYQVQDGDTLDSVAMAALGSRGRADELGLTQAQLAAQVGRYIRLPAA